MTRYGAFSVFDMVAETVSTIGFESLVALLLLAAASVFILKSFGFRGAPLVSVVAVLVAISSLESAFREISDLAVYLGEISGAREYVRAALKVVGISYLSGIGLDVCREIGEAGISRCISLLTRIELLLISMPLVKEMLVSLVSLLGE